MKRSRHSQRAVALPLVLWAVFVVTTVVVVTLRMVDFDLDLEKQASKRMDARQGSLTGLALASHPKIKKTDPLLFQTLPNGTKLEVIVENEDARLNINTVLKDKKSNVLKNLFRLWGINERDAAIAIDSLRDWVDPDDLRSLNGAEREDLAGEDFSLPENRPFLRVEEMEKVRGMDAVSRAKPDWKNYFSVKSSNVLDLEDVSPDLLRAVGGLSQDDARNIVDFRNGADRRPRTLDDQEIKSVDDIGRIIALPPEQAEAFRKNFGAGSKLRRIISRATLASLTHEIVVITNVGTQGTTGQTSYLEWLEK